MLNNKIQYFTDLNTWKEGHKLVLLIYKITSTFPKTEIYSLTDQIRRAAVSVTSNIAEGFGRASYKEKIQFYFNSRGSLTEVENQTIIAKDLGYLTTSQFDVVTNQIKITQKLIQGLIQKSKTYV